MLAAANALSGDADLVAGTQLKVPGVDVSKNDATTFKPYNPNEIIGSTAPGLPYIPPQPKSGCSALATIIRVVVAVVLAYVAPQIGYAMLIAGAGETVAQTVEIKQGYREQYNVGAIVVAVASAGIPNGGTTTWGKIGIAAMRAAGNYATSYLVNKALGIQDSFSWRGVATAAVTAAVSQAAFGNLPTETAAAQSATGSMVSATAAFSWSRVAQAAVVAVKEAGKSIVRSGISYAVEKAIVGESHWNWGIGYYYDAPSRDLQDSLSPVLTIRDEQGMEIFYNFAVTPWLTMGVDLQVINPSLGEDTAIIPGLRAVTRF